MLKVVGVALVLFGALWVGIGVAKPRVHHYSVVFLAEDGAPHLIDASRFRPEGPCVSFYRGSDLLVSICNAPVGVKEVAEP